MPDSNDEPRSLFISIQDALESDFTLMDWAQEEIDAATTATPHSAEPLSRSFILLAPTQDLARTEIVYRAHCREILRRVVLGQDTRPGTAAECCAALSQTSLRAPLTTSAAGLYSRMWSHAELPPVDATGALEHYEALDGARIDDLERGLRTRLRQDWRVLGTEHA